MLPCIVIDFLLNNQPEALIIPILLLQNSTCFGHLLCPSSGVFYFTFSTGKFRRVSDDRFQAKSGWDGRETYQCRMYSRKLLMMGRDDARNM